MNEIFEDEPKENERGYIVNCKICNKCVEDFEPLSEMEMSDFEALLIETLKGIRLEIHELGHRIKK